MATYKYNTSTGKVELIGTRNGKLKSGVYWPKDAGGNNGYYSESCGVRFRSKEHKRKVLKEKRIAEA